MADTRTQEQLDDALVERVAVDIVNGNRTAARLAIRLHADPAWFVLELLDALTRDDSGDLGYTLTDLRRLMRGPHE